MYNLLLVDDEKIIREGIYELLSMEESLELNLFMAASAIEAEGILEERKIDIVLTDIQMPQVTGIELMDIIRKRWPHCKIIFLTGYSEFDYVYQVHNYARYVLKAEEDGKIVEAVQEAIEEIENDFLIEQITRNSSVLKQQQQEHERSIFLKDLMEGYATTTTLSQEVMNRLGISLDLNKPIYYCILHYDHATGQAYEDYLVLLENMQILIEKYFFATMQGVSVNYNKNFTVLLFQPQKLLTTERSVKSIQGISELFQKACRKNFEMFVSIFIGAKPLPLFEVIDRFQHNKAKLLMSSEEGIILTDLDEALSSRSETQNSVFIKDFIHSKITLIDYYFENASCEMVNAMIQEAKDFFRDTKSMHDLFAVEIYSAIAAKLINYINQFGLSQEMCFKISVINLYNVTLHQNWEEAFNYLMSITNFIFELKMANMEKKSEDVINKVKKYIKEHLDGDTSLDTLSSYVNLSPEYLLRLFKKKEEVTILNYISDLKMIKAKKLVSNFDLQIKDIADQLGFTSAGYFSRFFKSKTGLNPQAYREKLEKDNGSDK